MACVSHINLPVTKETKDFSNSDNLMQSAHLSLGTKGKIMKSYPSLRSLICLISAFSLLLLTSCTKKESWLSCVEKYKGNVSNQSADFFIQIMRTNVGIDANYIDPNNSVRAVTTETPIIFNVSVNIYPSEFKRRIVQTFFLIDKKTLEFSKQVSPFDRTKLDEPPKFTGGIAFKMQEAAKS